MTVQDWAAFAISITSLIGAFAMMIRWMVKHYLYELKKNGGSSMRDDVVVNTQRLERVEKKQDEQGKQISEIYSILLSQFKPN
jgi:rRNA-processing protein FCF1